MSYNKLATAFRVFAPPPKLSLSQWAEENRRLSGESSAEQGRYSTSRAPYQKSMLDALNESCQKIIFKTSAQIGKTTIIENILGYYVSYDPSPILLCMPTLALAQAFSKDRLSPMVRDTPILRDKISLDRAKDGSNTILYKSFPGGHLTLSGANSPASLASRPIRVLLCDELSRWPDNCGTEGNPFLLAQKRTTAFHNKKIVVVSTPGMAGICQISHEFELSDKRYFMLACPHCSARQSLIFENLKYEIKEEKLGLIFYECQTCKGKIEEYHKPLMLKNGIWEKQNPTSNIAGFHLNELYSPWRKWGEVITDYLAAKDHPERLKVFVNTSLGLEFQDEVSETPDWRGIYTRRENFSIKLIPDDVLLLTAGVDVQKDRLEVSIVGWNRRRSIVLDHLVIPGDTFDPHDDSYRELEKIIESRFVKSSGKPISISKTSIDCGYNYDSVLSFVRRQDRSKVMAVKGIISDDPLKTPKKSGITYSGRTTKANAPLIWYVGTNTIKTQLYQALKIPFPTDEERDKTGFHSSFVHFSNTLQEEYFKQLTGEKQVYFIDKFGKERSEFRKHYYAVEALDCYVYACASYYGLGADRWPESRWEDLIDRKNRN